MSTFPFTQHGINQVLEALYQLPEEILLEEVSMIQHDLIKWLNEHFDLEENQQSYLQRLPNNLVYMVSRQLCIAIYNRLPIILNANSTDQLPHQAYENIRAISVTETTYNPSLGFQSSGSLTLCVNY
ncbi:hypothetical protein RYH73_14080 [Olivibacter sp. CPCC 100613]|uniref:hypothetical protein n=1 Tax=Olivibacter sp. CPCC 100613 TaxID=3079931 RepID=UPI002FF4ECFA